jgi:hypothetical protein
MDIYIINRTTNRNNPPPFFRFHFVLRVHNELTIGTEFDVPFTREECKYERSASAVQ